MKEETGSDSRSGAVVIRRCGACGKKFKSPLELYEHLKVCELAVIGRKAMEKWNSQKFEDEE